MRRRNRVEERSRGKRRRSDADRRGERKHPGRQRDEPNEQGDEQPGQQEIRDRPADQPVDLVEPVLEDADADADRQGADPNRAEIADESEEPASPGEGDREDATGPARDRSDDQQFQLLTLLADRAPVARHDPREPGDDRHAECREEDRLDNAPDRGGARRVVDLHEIATRSDANRAARDRGDCDRERAGDPDDAKRDEAVHRPAPASRRQVPGREELDRNAEEEDGRRPARLEEHCERSERQVVMVAVHGHCVERAELVELCEEAGEQQRPADRVRRPAHGDEQADRRERERKWIAHDAGVRMHEVRDRKLAEEEQDGERSDSPRRRRPREPPQLALLIHTVRWLGSTALPIA